MLRIEAASMALLSLRNMTQTTTCETTWNQDVAEVVTTFGKDVFAGEVEAPYEFCDRIGYGLVTGRNANASVTYQYTTPFAFTVELQKVTIELPQSTI